MFFFLYLALRLNIFNLKNLIFSKILCKKFYFSPLNTFMIKGKDPKPDPYLYADPADPDPQRCF